MRMKILKGKDEAGGVGRQVNTWTGHHGETSKGAHVVCVKGSGTSTQGSSLVRDHDLDGETACSVTGLWASSPATRPLLWLKNQEETWKKKTSVCICHNHCAIPFQRLQFQSTREMWKYQEVWMSALQS